MTIGASHFLLSIKLLKNLELSITDRLHEELQFHNI